MKKSKFITGLSAAFISAMALMSCSSSLKAKDGVILTIDGVPYTAQDLFDDQKTPAAAEAKFNAVYKVAVRAYFTKDPGKQEMAEITNNTKIKINEQKATAQSNADKNGTSYNEEWQKILDSNGVDDENGLYNKFEYDLQKEKFENNFYDDHYAELRKGNKFPGVEDEFTSYIEGKQPYHIKHILIKIDGAKADDVTNTEITAEKARQIGGLIVALARGDSFETLAHQKTYNDDEAARDNYGSLGIMSRDTSFVNDFKLGIYMYESFYGSSTKTDDPTGTYQALSAKKALHLDSAVDATKAAIAADEISKLDDPSTTDGTSTYGIGQIPYGAAEMLLKYADMDFTNDAVKNKFTAAGVMESDVKAKYYPRNVIFNKYFNKHNIMVITPRDLHTFGGTDDKLANYTDGHVRTNKGDTYLGKLNTTTQTLPGFKQDKKKNNDALNITLKDEAGTADSNVLRDDHGRVILVFRSGTGDSSNDAYQGIHFVVIERSPFIGIEYDEGDEEKTNIMNTSIDEYYTNYYPKQTGAKGVHPEYHEGQKDWKHTFVNYFSGLDLGELKARADTVKGELRKCDPKLETYLYQNLINTGEIQFNPKMKEEFHIDIEKDINDWIKISRTTNKWEENKTWDETWEDYAWSLNSQNEQREEMPSTTRMYCKLVPEVCAIAFDPNTGADFFTGIENPIKTVFGQGGVFHE